MGRKDPRPSARQRWRYTRVGYIATYRAEAAWIRASVPGDAASQEHGVTPLRTTRPDALRLHDYLIKQGYFEQNIVVLSDDGKDSGKVPTRENTVR